MHQFDRPLSAEVPQSVPFHNPGGPYPPSVAGKWDTRRPDRLPPRVNLQSIWRYTALFHLAGPWSALIIWRRAWRLHVLALVFSVIAQFFGAVLMQPLVLTIACGVGLSLGIKELRRRIEAVNRLGDRSLPDGSAQDPGSLPWSRAILAPLQIVARFYLPLAIPLLMSSGFSHVTSVRMVSSVIEFLIAAVATDTIATHYAYFMTQNPKLRYSSTRRRQAWWNLRLQSWRVEETVERLEAAAIVSTNAGDAFTARSIRRQISERKVISEYCAGILPVLLGAALATVVPARMFPPAYIGICIAWAYRRPRAMLSPFDFCSRILNPAISSWLMSNIWEHPLSPGPPGGFKSPIGIYAERLLIVGFPCFLLSMQFVPLPIEWGVSPLTSIRELLLFALDETYLAAFPVIVLIGTLIAVAGPVLSTFYREIESPGGAETMERADMTDFMAFAQKLAESSDLREREHILIGFHSELGYPILVPRKCFTHSIYVGPTGRGKTSIGVAQRLVQEIMRGDRPIVVIDNKGDSALFHEVRDAAKRYNRPFRHFATEIGRSTHAFNPIPSLSGDRISTDQMTQSLADCLRLYYSERYGEKFFAAISLETLQDVFERYPEIASFEEAYLKLGTREFFDRDLDRDRAKEVVVTLKRLASIEPLNWTAKKNGSQEILAEAIYMPRVLENNEIIYFWLPIVGESAHARDVSNLGAYDLLTACKVHQIIYGRAKDVVLLIDEFQAMASVAFETLIQQSRSYGISILMANQTLTDLEKNSSTLLNSLLSNTGFRMFQSPCDPDTEDYLIEQSGESMYWYYIHFPPGLKPGERFNRNDVKAITSKPLSAFVQIPFDTDFACYGGHLIPVQLTRHMSKEAYEELSSRPWPEPTSQTIVVKKRVSPAPAQRREAKLLRDDEEALPEQSLPSIAAIEWKDRLDDAYRRRVEERGL